MCIIAEIQLFLFLDSYIQVNNNLKKTAQEYFLKNGLEIRKMSSAIIDTFANNFIY